MIRDLVGQEFALSLILSALYIALIFHILEKRTKIFSIPILIFFMSFVDDGLLIIQEKSFEKSNTNLFCSYSIISSLFRQFSLVIKYNKSEVFNFSRLTKNFNPPLLDLRPLGGTILKQKDTWQYLEFFVNRKLLFYHHTHYYANKALSIIKSMKMLYNSVRWLSLMQKCLLYKTFVLPITLYSF